ncbi:MAG: radical SAM protein [Sphingomonadales bacterium]|nr:radical SAM protein [Sphingomonadales bacterium]
MRVRVVQIDGKLPNLALMRISAHHRGRGDDVVFTRRVTRDLFEYDYDRVYASAIFSFSRSRLDRLVREFQDVICGGTGVDRGLKVEDVLTVGDHELDYSIYPGFEPSIGFTQRGCRMKCRFCVVPAKEGANHSVLTVEQIWRGAGHAKKLLLLDNDFFGQEHWRERIKEIREGGFKVCLSQGINVRLITDEAAEAMASVEYRDDQFRRRRLYTAWDNIGDEQRFFDGIDRLNAAGIPSRHVMAYMLVGYDRRETWDRIFHRFDRMVERGILPYPMVYDNARKDLKRFQRWVVTGLYRAVPFSEYDAGLKARSMTA